MPPAEGIPKHALSSPALIPPSLSNSSRGPSALARSLVLTTFFLRQQRYLGSKFVAWRGKKNPWQKLKRCLLIHRSNSLVLLVKLDWAATGRLPKYSDAV